MNAETKVIQKLRLSQKTLSVAESCTGGLVSHRLTNVPGASEAFLGAIVCYSNSVKAEDLRVPDDVLQAHGAVSSEVAVLMARGVRQRHRADFGLGITGIAGPGGGSKGKPVGLVYMAAVSGDEALCLKCQFEGDRGSVKQKTSTQALKLIYEFVC